MNNRLCRGLSSCPLRPAPRARTRRVPRWVGLRRCVRSHSGSNGNTSGSNSLRSSEVAARSNRGLAHSFSRFMPPFYQNPPQNTITHKVYCWTLHGLSRRNVGAPSLRAERRSATGFRFAHENSYPVLVSLCSSLVALRPKPATSRRSLAVALQKIATAARAFLYFFHHVFFILPLRVSHQSISVRPSLRQPVLLYPFLLTDLGAGRNGNRCCCCCDSHTARWSRCYSTNRRATPGVSARPSASGISG